MLRKPSAISLSLFSNSHNGHSTSGTRKVVPFPAQRSLADAKAEEAFRLWKNGDSPKMVSRALRVGESFVDLAIRERVMVIPPKKAA